MRFRVIIMGIVHYLSLATGIGYKAPVPISEMIETKLSRRSSDRIEAEVVGIREEARRLQARLGRRA
jgi:ribosomal protein S1